MKTMGSVVFFRAGKSGRKSRGFFAAVLYGYRRFCQKSCKKVIQLQLFWRLKIDSICATILII